MYTAAQERSLTKASKTSLKTELTSEHLEALRDQLRYHEWKYYVQNAPVLSDYEYDQLYKKLEALEAAHPEFITPDSPTQRVSPDLAGDLPTVEHLTPMLSLANSYNAEDLKEWDTQVKKVANLAEDVEVEYVVEPKFDGGSIAIVYENDLLTRAATRGNGRKGEEMTHNARAMNSVPLRINFSDRKIKRIEVRGEVLIRKDIFQKVNEEREAAGLSVFANPRNAATGGLRMKDASASAQRRMEAFIYQLGFAENEAGENALNQFATHEETIQSLAQAGFKVPRLNEERKICKNIAEVVQFCLDWQEKREAYDYEVDGMVVKVNSLALQREVGYTSHHPRWAIAFKFKAKQATSKLLNVDFQVGKIGSITPVAKIEPVPLAGVTVSSISLHNEDFITNKDLRIGDTVLVERAGDVIPYIVKAMEELRDGSETKIEFPTACPVCTTPLVREESGAAWRCPNTIGCEAQVLQRMIHHISKNAMNIDSFGKSYVERFHQMGWLKSLADIYRLDYDKISELEGFGEKSAKKLERSIEQAKQNPIHRLLHSLSIHHVGKSASKLLAAEIEHVLDLKNWTIEDFTNIHDIGPVVSENVIAFFKDEAQVAILEEMESLGVNMKQTEADRPKAVSADAPLIGKTILFTGSLQNISRKAAQEKAEAAGARNISAVSSKLNILVVGEKPGSKLKKAQALGTVEVLTEAEFLTLIGGE